MPHADMCAKVKHADSEMSEPCSCGYDHLMEMRARQNQAFCDARAYAVLRSRLSSEELVEELADLEHAQWAHWTRYMLSTLSPLLEPVRMVGSPEYVKAHEALLRWTGQTVTPYGSLSEAEKESDREWARKVLAVLQ